ncbi:PLDc N-terminal domain-containing protein [Planococcus halocryophilus]|uniref:PLDc N-terminal domain-containing protein n=1 Tax=Planococcus halocryophilus TaxID=1215089 RepID=UPI001F200563|nr:PLDc N-terminal domain-containing protein [Planococcus halocryophilus]
MSNIFVVVNVMLAIFILFFERKTATSAWAWILILFFVPIVGFVLYLLFGKSLRPKRLNSTATYDNKKFKEYRIRQLNELKEGSFRPSSKNVEKWLDLIQMNMSRTDAPLSTATDIQIFNDGTKKFNALFEDICKAKDHVHLQYFILNNDDLGRRLIGLLTKKAKQGVNIRFLYDDLGSKNLPKDFFDEFHASGGIAVPFLPALMSSINPRLNHRNHRKLVVVDGSVGYIGGFNVGDEYLGKKELGYWRDTHLRLEGSIIYSLQNRFLLTGIKQLRNFR